ncbi:MAG TPA: DNA polymerase III subunit beta [Armatimonadota bacterium]|nr:DNA polymerase III subunit beta [Armatimonadota bacterium]
MRAVCARKDLYQGVQTVSRAIAGRSAWPILNNILIRTEPDHLRLTAFDLELGIECTAPAAIEEEGSLTVPARLISEVLSTLPEADVRISVDEQNMVNVKCEKSDYMLLGLPPEEFRPLPEIPDDRSFEITQGALRDMIKHTIFAVSPDESRAILTGILLELNGDGIKLVSTDTNRLAIRTSTVGKAAGEASCIVPRRALDELSRMLEDEDSPVTISIADSQIKFVVNGVTIVSRLIEGQFPNYERVIPGAYEKKLTMPAEEFLARVRRASIVARENANRLILKTDGDRLIMTAESGDVGKAYEELEIVKEGEDIEIAFNAKFLIDFLSVVGAEGIFMELTGPLSQGVMKPVGRDDYLYVLMPMQIM